MPLTSLQGEQGRRVLAALRERARVTAEEAKARNRERDAQRNREMFTALAKYGTPSPGHERGALDLGLLMSGAGENHRGMMYNEPWHWPPKTKEESMALTQEQFQAALEIRDIVVSAIADAVHSFHEPIDLNEDDSRAIAEGIAEDLFNHGYIALDVVDGDR